MCARRGLFQTFQERVGCIQVQHFDRVYHHHFQPALMTRQTDEFAQPAYLVDRNQDRLLLAFLCVVAGVRGAGPI